MLAPHGPHAPTRVARRGIAEIDGDQPMTNGLGTVSAMLIQTLLV